MIYYTANAKSSIELKVILTEFIDQCRSQALKMLYKCLSARIIHHTIQYMPHMEHRNAMTTVTDFSVRHTWNNASATSETFYQHFHKYLVQVLNSFTSKCLNCTYWTDNHGNIDQAKALDAAKTLDDILDPSDRRMARAVVSMDLASSLALKVKIDQLGTLLIWYRIVQDKITKYFDSMVNTLLDSNNDITSVSIWRMSSKSKENDFFVKACNPTMVSILSCFTGTFKEMLTLMKENNIQPHMFNLNYMFNDQFNFTGPLTDVPIQYPMDLNHNQTRYPLKIDSNLNYQDIQNWKPFIPYFSIADKFANPPMWGVSYESFDLFGTDDYLDQACNSFRPSLTDNGICYTFNGAPTEDFMKPSLYMNSYMEVFGLPRKSYWKEPMVANGVGLQNGLQLVLDAHTLTGQFAFYAKADNTFRLSLQHPHDFPLPLLEGIDIKGGYRTV